MPAIDDNAIITGVISLVVGSMLGPMAGDLWRKIKGSEYATKRDCAAKHKTLKEDCITKHETEKEDCTACRAATKATVCAVQHESLRYMKLLRIIAIHVQVPADKLDEFL